MEQSLVLIAAWQDPRYQRIALEFTMEGRVVSIEALVRELQKQLLTAHLNQSGSDRSGGDRSCCDEVRVRAVTASQPRYCFGFQKGKCTRADCPFLHEKSPETTQPQNSQRKPKVKSAAVGAGAGAGV